MKVSGRENTEGLLAYDRTDMTRDLGRRSMTVTRRQLLGAGAVAAAATTLRPLSAFAGTAPAVVEPARGDLAAFVADRMRAVGWPASARRAIVHDGAVGWARGFGLANVWRDRPVGQETLFMLASIPRRSSARRCSRRWRTDTSDSTTT